MAKSLIAMSGGVDSTVAAALLLENGYECTGFTFKFSENAGADLNDARKAAEQLGLKHHVLDFSEVFCNKVIQPFIEAYEQGLTPNPCIICNRHVKFAFPLFYNAGLEFDVFATGHYAQTEKSGGRFLVKKAVDHSRDQSYVLFSLDQQTLSRICFPLGSLTKDKVREIARERGIVNAAKQDSQDICFVPDGDYGAFMEAFTGKTYPPGDILDIHGNPIGRHNGHVRYTLGQRRGLGVAANEPVYVKSKDTERNTITLGPENSLYSKTLIADRINFITCDTLEKPTRFKVKTRYHMPEHSAWVEQIGDDEIRIDFDEAQRALTPGQAAVLYDGDIVAGGGIIRDVLSKKNQL